jgi:hypothetical protein
MDIGMDKTVQRQTKAYTPIEWLYKVKLGCILGKRRVL